ncbi:hypothetical protein C8R42DRAFT_326524 [Lentinula raphanica]|nr:hypothetical protein C8R42DRAFT_326524 [Lentinula raphanica]
MAHSIHPFQSHEELPTETSRPPEDTVYPSLSFRHLSSSDFSGGRYALRRHHANSYPAVTPGSARGRSGYPMSPHPNPIPTYTTSLAPPQVLVRRSEDTVSNINNDYLWSISTLSASPPLSSVSRTTSSDPGMLSTLAFEHPLSPYSFSRPVAAAMGLHDNNESDQHWEYDVSGRSESGSPIRSEMHTGFPSAPLPYNPTYFHGNEIYPRRRASSTRSSLIARDATPTTSPFWHSSTNSNMLMPSAFEEARRRPLSRASPPPSSPASPVNELRPGRRNIFPVHEHRRTSTWGGRWSNRQPSSPASYASPSPTPSLSPHREPVAMHTNQTWEQVENDRRRELASESPLELERIHEAGENKSVDITQLMSTEQMGWEQVPLSISSSITCTMMTQSQQTRSSWPLHHAVSEEEMARTQTRQVNDLEMSPTTWTSASVGRTGYVASIIDPQLSASEPYLGSPKTSQDLADVRLEGHSMPSTAHLQPSNFTSSSYSSLSGWAGEENSPSVLSPSPFDDYHYPSGTGVLGDPVTNSTTPSPPLVPQ